MFRSFHALPVTVLLALPHHHQALETERKVPFDQAHSSEVAANQQEMSGELEQVGVHVCGTSMSEQA
jgi:hypothetical protein